MATIQKSEAEIVAYWLAAAFIFIVLSRYGRQAAEWIIMKLYDFFIQRNPMRQ